MNQLIFISSRLWKSKTHQIKFPNKFGRKGAKHSRTICVNVRVQTVRVSSGTHPSESVRGEREVNKEPRFREWDPLGGAEASMGQADWNRVSCWIKRRCQ